MDTANSAPLRAGRAYLEGGQRLDSACGVSEMWYHHVGTNPREFLAQDACPIELSQPASVYPGLDDKQISETASMFGWERFHLTRQKEGELPTDYALIPSSSPLPGASLDSILQTKTDAAERKPSGFKNDPAVDSKREVGEAITREPSGLGVKRVSIVRLGSKEKRLTKSRPRRKTPPKQRVSRSTPTAQGVTDMATAFPSLNLTTGISPPLSTKSLIRVWKHWSRSLLTRGR